MTRRLSILFVTFFLVACGDPHLDYNNNNGEGGNTNNVDPPQTDVPWVDINLSSSSKLAFCAQDEMETLLCEVTFTSEDCDGGRPGFALRVPRNSAVVVSAASDLLIETSDKVQIRYVRQDPEHDYSYWNYTFLLGEFYDNNPQWELIRFPTATSQLGGLRRGLSGFVCAMGYDMATSGCQGAFPKAFFVDRGTSSDMTIIEQQGDMGELFVLIRIP